MQGFARKHLVATILSFSQYADVMVKLRKSAPKDFAAPEVKLNARRDLVVEGETFRWEKDKGIYRPLRKYRPYTAADTQWWLHGGESCNRSRNRSESQLRNTEK